MNQSKKELHTNSCAAAHTYHDASLPDMQNAGSAQIKGANVPIMQVGMHNFKLPLKFLSKDCEVRELEASVTGTVSLAADAKGINMSRIMRTFYTFKDRIFTPEILEEILRAMKRADYRPDCDGHYG